MDIGVKPQLEPRTHAGLESATRDPKNKGSGSPASVMEGWQVLALEVYRGCSWIIQWPFQEPI